MKSLQIRYYNVKTRHALSLQFKTKTYASMLAYKALNSNIY